MKPRLLAIESSATLCSVAVCGFETDAFLVSEPGQKHTEVILGMLQRCLASSGGSYKELDAIVFGAGPGAFTGLRVSCGLAQGLGWALDKPLIPAITLEALVDEHIPILEDGTNILCATDARMHEVYCCVYKITSGVLKPISAISLVKPENLQELASRYDVSRLCGNAFKVYANEIGNLLASKSLLSVEEPNSKMILSVGLKAWKEGQWIKPEQASPLYIRDNVAMTIQERKKAGLTL